MGCRSARIALALILVAPLARPCSIIVPRDVPFSFDHYAFYGEVIGHASTPLVRCGDAFKNGKCPSTWGLRIRILQPVHVPARNITEVEYFDFGLDSMCAFAPSAEEFVKQQFPVGTRVALAASLYTADEPTRRQIRLTQLVPQIFGALAVLPKNADLPKLAATPFVYESSDASRERFELWRDKLRLQETRTEREALSILQRMAVSDELGEYTGDDTYSDLEQLVDQYLPTPSVREEFARKLREQRQSRVDQ
jgi:hypothetical protein